MSGPIIGMPTAERFTAGGVIFQKPLMDSANTANKFGQPRNSKIISTAAKKYSNHSKLGAAR
jgi:hypothetical protein